MAEYWTLSAPELGRELGSSEDGLADEEAASRLSRFGPNALREQSRLSRLRVLWNQLRSPLLWLLLFGVIPQQRTVC